MVEEGVESEDETEMKEMWEILSLATKTKFGYLMSEIRKTQFFCWAMSTPQFPRVVSSFLNGEKKPVLLLQSLIDGYLVKLEEEKLSGKTR